MPEFSPQQFEQARLGVGVKLRFFDPAVSVGEIRPDGGLPEIEIREESAVRELVLEAFHDGLRSGGDILRQKGFPQPLPDVAGPAPMEGGLPLETHIDIGQMPLHGLPGFLLDRQEFHPSVAEGLAGRLQRAGEAGGVHRRAAGGAEVHHALVEGGGRFRRQEPLGERREFLLRGRRPDRRRDAEISRENAVDVPVHDGGREAEGDGADGRGRVVAHALEAPDTLQRGREAAHRHDLLRRGVQVPGAGIVAEPLPEAEHLVLGRGREGADGREALHEPLPVGPSLGHTRLLEDDFAQPHRIRVPGPPPREVPAVLGVPAEDGLGKDHAAGYLKLEPPTNSRSREVEGISLSGTGVK